MGLAHVIPPLFLMKWLKANDSSLSTRTISWLMLFHEFSYHPSRSQIWARSHTDFDLSRVKMMWLITSPFLVKKRSIRYFCFKFLHTCFSMIFSLLTRNFSPLHLTPLFFTVLPATSLLKAIRFDAIWQILIAIWWLFCVNFLFWIVKAEGVTQSYERRNTKIGML